MKKKWDAEDCSSHGGAVLLSILYGYRNDPKFSDRQVWANSADPDPTATLFAIPFASFGCIILR